MLSNNLIKKTIIFTDLDGTLLDHDTYSFEPALPLLDFIKRHDIPLIIVTSKTKSEVIDLQDSLDLHTPFIIENGAGIFIPENGQYTMIPLGKNYIETRKAFERYAHKFAIHGFFDMKLAEIATLTGLSLADAGRAKQRTFSEPFLLDDETEIDRLTEVANRDGFDIVKGGRFYHLITKGQDKANAIKKVIELYQERAKHSLTSIALGDSANDLTMLESVDIPVLIPHQDGSYIHCDISNLTRAPYPGPKGWNSVLKEYFHVK